MSYEYNQKREKLLDKIRAAKNDTEMLHLLEELEKEEKNFNKPKGSFESAISKDKVKSKLYDKVLRLAHKRR